MVPLVIIIITITYAFISHHKVITSKAATTSDYKEQYQMLLPVWEIHLKAHTLLILTKIIWLSQELDRSHACNLFKCSTHCLRQFRWAWERHHACVKMLLQQSPKVYQDQENTVIRFLESDFLSRSQVDDIISFLSCEWLYVIDCTMHTARLPSALYCVRRICVCYLCCT